MRRRPERTVGSWSFSRWETSEHFTCRRDAGQREREINPTGNIEDNCRRKVLQSKEIGSRVGGGSGLRKVKKTSSIITTC